MSKERKKLFEVVVLYHEEIKNKMGTVLEINTRIVVSPTVILAVSQKEAEFAANRLVPEDFVRWPEFLELRIRPF